MVIPSPHVADVLHISHALNHTFQDNLSLKPRARFHMLFPEGKGSTYLQFHISLPQYLGFK
jgi:valyl-tRNA synthetase